MAFIPPLLPNDAPQEVKDVYEDFSHRMGFPAPPNFIMTQGHSPSVTEGPGGLVRNVLVNRKD
jgi:hypothetical protein